VRFRILGRVEALGEDGEPVDIGGPQPRALLAMLVLARNRIVPADTIVDALWGGEQKASSLGSLQTYVSRVRRALGSPDLVWESPGYRLAVDPDDVDAWRFERLATEGRAALQDGDPARARELLLEADALWRGPALGDVRDLDVGAGSAARLEELRLVALEDRLEADLRLGRHEVAVAELAELAAAHPFREGLHVQLAVALYRSGRQAEALRAIDDARRTLNEELGLDPSPPLRAVEAAILGHDPSLLLPAPAPASTPTATTSKPDRYGELVGRGPELDVLLAALDEASRRTCMVVVEGEPGIGKTRLAEELAAEAAEQGAAVVWGQCYEGRAAPAFWPWLAALRALVAALPETGSPPLEQFLAPSSDPRAVAAPANPFDLYALIASTLSAAASEQKLVVLLDDVQWADDASLELLGYLAGALRAAHVLVVLTIRELEIGRTGPLVDCLAAIARHRPSRRFRLHGLGDAAIAELLEAATGRPASPELVAAVAGRVDGNPFYALELARLLADRASPSAGVTAVPAGVRDVIRQRLARLPRETIDLLQVAALAGREVEASLLLRAGGDGSRRLDDLEPSLVHHVLLDVEGHPGTYRFSHALVREVLAEDLSSMQRARLHLRIGEAIASSSAGQEDKAEIIAEHLFAAAPLGDAGRTADALERAAAVAIRRTAYTVAEDLLVRAVRMREEAGTSAEHLSAELDAMVSLFFVQRIVGGHQAAMEGPTMRRAQALATELGRRDVLARLVWAEWVGADKAWEVERATVLAGQLGDLAQATNDPLVQGLSCHALGVSRWHAGDLSGAVEALDRAVLLSREANTGDHARIEALTAPLRPNAWPQGHPIVPFVHLLVGDLADPIAHYQQTVPASPRPFDPFDTTVLWMFAGFGALAIGDLDTAAAHARRGIGADPELASSYWGFGSQLCLAAALVAAGDLDQGLPLLDQALPRYLETGTRIFLALVDTRVAQGLGRAGRHAEADEALARSYAVCTTNRERWVEPVAMAVDAELRQMRGAPAEEVADLLRRARALATEQGAHAVARHVAETANVLGVPVSDVGSAAEMGRPGVPEAAQE
jgi:DNA-binding SARP family transcriptional activator